MKRFEILERNRATAARLLEARSKRSDADQVEVLNSRLGVGIGAKKERERLNAKRV